MNWDIKWISVTERIICMRRLRFRGMKQSSEERHARSCMVGVDDEVVPFLTWSSVPSSDQLNDWLSVHLGISRGIELLLSGLSMVWPGLEHGNGLARRCNDLIRIYSHKSSFENHDSNLITLRAPSCLPFLPHFFLWGERHGMEFWIKKEC